MRKQELHPRTAIINKSQKNRSKKSRADALAWLASRFPQAFDNSLCIRPLKKGIMDDILHYAQEAEESGISRSKLREAVVLFTRRVDYLTCLKSREMRIDLQGNVAEEVTEEEAEHAATKIKKRVEKSVRNARKVLSEKTMAQPVSSYSAQRHVSRNRTNTMHASTASEDFLPVYPARAPAYSLQNTNSQPAKVASVLIKSKATRQYDPEAVARLKERLGLSRKLEEKTEMSD